MEYSSDTNLLKRTLPDALRTRLYRDPARLSRVTDEAIEIYKPQVADNSVFYRIKLD